MHKIKSLVMMQLKDKIKVKYDSSWQMIRVIIFEILKFIGIAGIAFAIFYVLSVLTGIFFYAEMIDVLTFVLVISVLLSLVSCTFQLMKSLFYSDDNRVLITLPVDTNQIFISKLIVFYIYELKRNLTFLFPITFAGCLILIILRKVSILCLPWMFFVLLFVIMIPVLLGGLLSIGAMYIKKLFDKIPVLKLICLIAVIALCVFLVVEAIFLIPDTINIATAFVDFKTMVISFIRTFVSYLGVIGQLFFIVIGEQANDLVYHITLLTLLKFVIMTSVCVALYFLNYFISRPIFFNIMAKNFEINKNIGVTKPNEVRGKYATFVHKELLMNLKSLDISVNFLVIYIVVPILTLLLNKIYLGIPTRTFGDVLICTFNVFLILLPMLASNAKIATYYSREGRSAYIKKTKPVNIIYPLTIKIIFNLILSVISMIVTTIIFGKMLVIHLDPQYDVNIGMTFGQILCCAVFFVCVEVGHMLHCASLDIMNPQNEQYATTGDEIDNPNENKATISAFVVSALFTVVAYKLFSEANQIFTKTDLIISSNALTTAVVKLMIVGVIFLVACTYLYIKKIKAYYYEI